MRMNSVNPEVKYMQMRVKYCRLRLYFEMRSLMPTSRKIVCRYENKDHSGKQFSSRASNCLFFKILTEESKLESPVGMDIHVFGIKLESVLNCGSEFRVNRDPVVETACYQTTSQGSGFQCRPWSEDLSHTFGNLIWLPRPDLNKDRLLCPNTSSPN